MLRTHFYTDDFVYLYNINVRVPLLSLCYESLSLSYQAAFSDNMLVKGLTGNRIRSFLEPHVNIL